MFVWLLIIIFGICNDPPVQKKFQILVLFFTVSVSNERSSKFLGRSAKESLLVYGNFPLESYHNEDSQLFTNIFQTTFTPKHIDYTQGLSDVDARTLLERIDPKVVEYAKKISKFNVSFI